MLLLLLKTLTHLGVAAQTSGGKYVPGPGMHVLAAQSTDSEIRDLFKGKEIPGHAGIGALLENKGIQYEETQGNR